MPKPCFKFWLIFRFIWHVIHQTRETVCRWDIQTPRRELKIWCIVEHFWRNSRCLDSRWNTVSVVWYILSIETKTKLVNGEVKINRQNLCYLRPGIKPPSWLWLLALTCYMYSENLSINKVYWLIDWLTDWSKHWANIDGAHSWKVIDLMLLVKFCIFLATLSTYYLLLLCHNVL